MFFLRSVNAVLNHEVDLLELIRKVVVNVHIASVNHLKAQTVVLSGGERLQSYALICCPWWKHTTPPLTFLPKSIVPSLDFLHQIYSKSLSPLEARADEETLSRFPALKDQPANKPSWGKFS